MGPIEGHALATTPAGVLLCGGHRPDGLAEGWWHSTGRGWVGRSGGPSPRHGHGLCFDASRGRVVLFGGCAHPGGKLRDTWEWGRETGWTEIEARPRPPGLYRSALAYDEARGVAVLFGGGTGSDRSSEHWEWDGARWKRRAVETPRERSGHAMAYDAEREVVVLFGGRASTERAERYDLNDTWEWDGERWVERRPEARPTPRRGHALVFDRARGRVVLFGGRDSLGYCDDTWEWDGRTWRRRRSSAHPPARSGHALAYHPGRRAVVVVGGDRHPHDLDDVWEWDGERWEQTGGRDWTEVVPPGPERGPAEPGWQPEPPPGLSAERARDPGEPTEEVERRVDAVRDEDLSVWLEALAELDPQERIDVAEELGARFMEAYERAPDEPPNPRDLQALQALQERGELVPEEALEAFADLLVWRALHLGHAEQDVVFRLGEQAVVPLLRLRRDRHVHTVVPHFLAELVPTLLGAPEEGERLPEADRPRATEDADPERERVARREERREALVRAFEEALRTCKPEHAPYYQGLLAACGRRAGLEGALELLDSELVADQVFVHELFGVLLRDERIYRDFDLAWAVRDAAGVRPPDPPQDAALDALFGGRVPERRAAGRRVPLDELNGWLRSWWRDHGGQLRYDERRCRYTVRR